jgi:hypothetical protein
MGVFIGPWGSSTDLEKLVWLQVVPDRPSYVASRLGGVATTNFLHGLGLLLLVHTRVLKATGQTDIKHGWLAGRPLGPFVLGFGSLGPCVKYTLVVNFTLSSLEMLQFST